MGRLRSSRASSLISVCRRYVSAPNKQNGALECSLQEVAPLPSSQPTFGAIPPFAPRPQPSALSSTPILTQHIEEDEPEVIRYVYYPSCDGHIIIPQTIREWRERQAEEIRARDEASKAKRQETISKAERAIDQFYEEYNTKKERNILENKCVLALSARSTVSPN